MKKIIVAVILLLTLCLNMFAMASCSKKGGNTSDFVVPEEGFDTSTLFVFDLTKIERNSVAKIGDTTGLVKADNAMYLFFYAGEVENVFV